MTPAGAGEGPVVSVRTPVPCEVCVRAARGGNAACTGSGMAERHVCGVPKPFLALLWKHLIGVVGDQVCEVLYSCGWIRVSTRNGRWVPRAAALGQASQGEALWPSCGRDPFH